MSTQDPWPPRKRRTLPYVLVGVGVLVLLCLGGVAIAAFTGSSTRISLADGYGKAVPPVDSPAVPATTEPTTPATTKPVATTTKPAATRKPVATTKPAVTTKPAAAVTPKVKVPNGVGLDYQSAQDRWRAAGLIVAPATDATGAHRLPVIDSNWVVLAQDLKAGSQVADGSVITATVKKYSDD